jgi:hypothetical protein
VLNAANITATGSVTGAQTSAAAPAAPAAAPVNANTTKTESFANTAASVPTDTWNLSVELLGIADDSASSDGQQNVTQDGQNPRSKSGQ